MASVKHALFDFFGTLVSYSESRVEQGYSRSYDLLIANGARLSYAEFLERWSATFDEFEAQAQHRLDEFSMDAVCQEFLARVLPPSTSATMALFRDTYLNEWNRGVAYIPGVPELLSELAKDITLVLVTNTHHPALVQQHLEAMNIAQHFALVLTSVEHGKRKPSACIFERALAQSGGERDSSIYIGDSFAADYQGATRAGLPCLLIDPVHRHDVPDAARLTHILDLRTHLTGCDIVSTLSSAANV